jgi:histone-lysine N-methyltransferase SUV39H
VLTYRIGVRSSFDIAKGQYIDRYVGEIITPQEAQRRRDASNLAQRKDVYLFALDKFQDPESYDPRFRGDPNECDGEFKSNPTRFINHSCDPNLRIFARVVDHADRIIHDLAFFAIDDIPAGHEFTFDYTDGVEERDKAIDIREHMGDMTPCLCGSENCRGFLW